MKPTLLALVVALTASWGASAPRIELVETAQTLDIRIDGKLFTTYRFAPTADDPDWHRPYFWPVLMADGAGATSDQARLQREQKTEADRKKIDHPWHRSIYVAHGDVNGIDHWTHKPGEKKLIRHLRFARVGGDSFVEELAWEGSAPDKPVLTEVRTVRVVAYEDGARGLDVKSELTAASGDAVFKVKPLNVSGVEAGWLAARVAPSISASKESRITSSAPAAGEKESRTKEANWCDYSGPVDGRTLGVALFSHPSNPGHPCPFHVRQFGMVTRVGVHDWTLAAGKSQAFRHLVLMHEGDAASAKLNERYEQFAREK